MVPTGLPASRKEEEALISAALIDPEYVLTEAPVTEGAFTDERLRVIWTAIASLHAADANITVLTIETEIERLKLGNVPLTYLTKLVANYESPYSAPRLAKSLIEWQKRREIVKAAADVTKQAYDVTIPAETISTKLTDALDGVVSEEVYSDGLELMDQIIIASANPQDNIRERIFTGYAGIDSTMLGIENGRFWVSAAVPNTGKSILTLNLARGVMSGPAPCGVLYLHPEQSDIELSHVMMSCGTRTMRPVRVKLVQLPKARREEYGRMLQAKSPAQTQQVFGTNFKLSNFTSDVTPDETAQMRSARSQLKWPIRFMDPKNWNVFVIRQRIRAMRSWLTRKYGPDAFLLVVVDGMHLLAGNNENSRVQELTTITRELKISAQNDVTPGAIIANHQLNYTFYQGDMSMMSNRRYTLRAMRDSGTVGQDADVVFFVDRQTVFEQDNAANVRPNAGGWDPFTIFVKKNRQTSQLFSSKFEMSMTTLAVRDKEEPWR